MLRRMLVVFTVAVLFSIAAQAAPIQAAPNWCVAGTIDTYIALGADGCQIDDKVFYNFDYSSSGSGGATAIPASGVTVNVVSTPLFPGFLFNAAWSVGPGQTLDSLIMYDVMVLPGGAQISDVHAMMVGYGFTQDGVVSVAENVLGGPEALHPLLVHSSGGTVSVADLFYSTPTVGPLHVAKDISVNGNNGTASVSGVYNRFSEVSNVPEPTSMVLFGSGLLVIGLVRRRLFHRS